MARRRFREVALTWLAIYPLVTALLAASENWLGGLPLPLRTLFVTMVMVPTTMFVAQPLLARLADRRSTRRPACDAGAPRLGKG